MNQRNNNNVKEEDQDFIIYVLMLNFLFILNDHLIRVNFNEQMIFSKLCKNFIIETFLEIH